MVWRMDIGAGCDIALSAKLDRANPRGVHVGADTAIAFQAVVLSYDFLNDAYVDTYIGSRCHIGARSLISPGVRVGDGSIVSPGSVVMDEVPSNSVVSGNPAQIVETGIRTEKWGIRTDPIPERQTQKLAAR
jgi:acetyltransferase-like isoleucine patch superfamily enzyme